MVTAIFEETSIVCALLNSGKGKAENKFYQSEYTNNKKVWVSYYDMWEGTSIIVLKSLNSTAE